MKKIIFTLLLFGTTLSFFAQKMKIMEGSFDNIKHINKYNVVFDYSNLKIHKYSSENEFISDKSFGSDSFKKKWFRDRKEFSEPEFIISFNKRFKNKDVVIQQNLNSRFILKMQVLKIYPGSTISGSGNGGYLAIASYPKLDANIIIYEKSKENDILFKAYFKKASIPLMYFSVPLDYGKRVAQAYSVIGREFGEKIQRKFENDPSFICELSDEEYNEITVSPENNNKGVNKEGLIVVTEFDVIYKKDGSEITSKIIEIDDETVKYRKSGQLDGPLRNINVNNVFMIIYKNGTREVFKNKS